MATSDSTSQSPQTSPIVVGVSGVTGSRQALQWAAREAQMRGGRVVAVMAWRGSGLPGGAPGRAPAQGVKAPQQRSVERELNQFVADALGEDHGVECRAVEGSAGPVLLQAAEGAALLVLDSPATAKLYDPGARKLAPQLLLRAACPVVVMPGVRTNEDVEADWEEAGEYVGQG